MSDSLQPHGLYSSLNSPGQSTDVGNLSLLEGDLPNPGMEPRSPTLKVDSLPAEPHGKPLYLEIIKTELCSLMFLLKWSKFASQSHTHTHTEISTHREQENRIATFIFVSSLPFPFLSFLSLTLPVVHLPTLL